MEMFISENQIEAVIKTLKRNKNFVSNGFSEDSLEELAVEIINNLNDAIYNGT
jgi:hypothetical protein